MNTAKRIPRIVAAPRFTLEELATLQHWCIKYCNLVRGGGTPTPAQDRRFLEFSAITYAMGVADVRP